MSLKEKSATMETARGEIEVMPHSCAPDEANGSTDGEVIHSADGISITVYRLDTVTAGDMPWRANVAVHGMLGTTTVKAFSKKAVVGESQAAAQDMIRLRNHWAREAIRSEPKAKSDETQLDLL